MEKKKLLKPQYILFRKDENNDIQFSQNGFNNLEVIGVLLIYLQKLSFRTHKSGYKKDLEKENPQADELDIESTGFDGSFLKKIINGENPQ